MYPLVMIEIYGKPCGSDKRIQVRKHYMLTGLADIVHGHRHEKNDETSKTKKKNFFN